MPESALDPKQTVVAKFLCVRSRNHTADERDIAIKFSPCGLHTQMAQETTDLIEYVDLRLRSEWKFECDSYQVRCELFAARDLMVAEADDNPRISERLTLYSRLGGLHVSGPWVQV